MGKKAFAKAPIAAPTNVQNVASVAAFLRQKLTK